MILKKYSTICCIILAGAIMSATAQAATVSILPSSSQVMPGASIVLDIKGTGFVGKADGGDFTVSWDDSVLDYTGMTLADPPWDTTFVDASDVATGKLNSVFLGASVFGGVGPDFDIATLSFDVIGMVGDSTMVEITTALVGWAAPGAVAIAVTYNDAEVSVVPIPASAYLLASGFAALAGLARKRKKTVA